MSYFSYPEYIVISSWMLSIKDQDKLFKRSTVVNIKGSTIEDRKLRIIYDINSTEYQRIINRGHTIKDQRSQHETPFKKHTTSVWGKT